MMQTVWQILLYTIRKCISATVIMSERRKIITLLYERNTRIGVKRGQITVKGQSSTQNRTESRDVLVFHILPCYNKNDIIS